MELLSLSNDKILAQVELLLEEYVEISKKPNSFLPVRSYGHAIELTLEAKPINLRPHYYSY